MADTHEPVDSQLDDQEPKDTDLEDVSDDEQDPDVLREAAKSATAKAKELADKNKQLFARTKKAEGFVLKDGKWVKPSPTPPATPPATPPQPTEPPKPEAGTITPLDAIAISKANVHEDDIQEVVDFAKFKGISVAEALKSDYVKTTLERKAEERQTAQATATGKHRSGSAAKTGEGLLEKARTTGELPESQADLEALAAARFPKK